MQRERANTEDMATAIVEVSKIGEADAWESQRLAAVREPVRAEATRRREAARAQAAAAIARVQQRGEKLAVIAELAGLGVGEIRAILRNAPKPEQHTASGASGIPSDDHRGADGPETRMPDTGGSSTEGVSQAASA